MQKIEHIPTNKLKSHSKNPRLIKDEDFEILCKSIKENPEYFEVRPILCNKDMVVFAGNMRLKAAKHLGLLTVPVCIMDISEEKQKELMIRDNVQNGQWDIILLNAEFDTEDLQGYGVDLESMGMFTDSGYGTETSLPNGEKNEFCQITFTLANEQAEAIRSALDEAMHFSEEYDHFGNGNKNGNALYAIIQKWQQQQKI